MRTDVEAAISTFMQSISVNFGVGGYNQKQMQEYIPAILFTLYDGYYIYSPTKTDNGYEYMLKPYNYYTVRYKDPMNSGNDVVINYTLDNYIAVYGWIGGDYVVKSGYLISTTNSVENSETLIQNVPYKSISDGTISIGEKEITSKDYNPEYVNNLNEQTDTRTDYLYPRNENFYIDPGSASNYYAEAKKFTNWATDKLSWITPSMAMRNAKELKELYEQDPEKYSDYEFFTNNTTKIFAFENNNPEDSTSFFSEHKTAVIRTSIQDNLNQAITAYSQGLTSSYDFKLPKLEENEWDMVSSNICMLTFLQGVPMGMKYYNNYALVQSTTNKLYTSPDSLYFIENGGDGYYHKIDCPHLGINGTEITGYSNFNFELKRVKISTDNSEYYYRFKELACYHCIIDSNYEPDYDWENNVTKKKAYYTALAREKYSRYKATEHLEYTQATPST